MIGILVAMGIIKSHHFVLDIFLIFGLCGFFLFKQKKILFKINSKLDVVMKFFFENIVDLSVNY